MTRSVVVVGGNRTALAVVRALARGLAGSEVHVAASAQRPVAAASRYVRAFHSIAPAEHGVQAVADLEAIGRGFGGRRPWLFPVNDADLLIVATHWDRLGEWFHPACEVRTSRLHACLDKAATHELAVQAGVPVPRRFANAHDFIASGAAYPAIVKPNMKGAEAALRARLPRLVWCHGAAELTAAVAAVDAAGVRPVIQEWIPGGDDQLYTFGFAALNGELLAGFTGRKLRQFPPTNGEASLAESLPDPEVAELGARLVRAAGFTGVGQVEFKRAEGVPYLIEINPRPWSWIALATACGVNLPAAFVSALEGAPSPPATQGGQRRWMLAVRDYAFHVEGHGLRRRMKWLWEAVTADVHAHWDWRDPGPVARAIPAEWRAVRALRGS